MLARSFLSATAIGITEQEYEALIKVLGLFERGEVHHTESIEGHIENGFNIAQEVFKCGTPSCIGGWAAAFMGKEGRTEITEYVDRYLNLDDVRHPLYYLYWQNTYSSTTVEQAAEALRNFLATGTPNWEEVLA